jgi:hypothetical protein
VSDYFHDEMIVPQPGRACPNSLPTNRYAQKEEQSQQKS